MTEPRTAAFAGCVGGAGTTRLTVEAAALLARAGYAAAVLDLDFATQGLAAYVPCDARPDATDLLTAEDPIDEAAVADAFVDVAPESSGSLAICPSSAPFTGVAAAKAPTAAERVEDVAGAVLGSFDFLVFDVPPVVANQAIAGVSVADRVAAITTPDDRGVDALARERGRLLDLGSGVDCVVANRTTPADAPPDADVAIPTADLAAGRPDSLAAESSISPAVGALVESLFDAALPETDERASVVDRVRDRLA